MSITYNVHKCINKYKRTNWDWGGVNWSLQLRGYDSSQHLSVVHEIHVFWLCEEKNSIYGKTQWGEHYAHLCSDSTIGLCCYVTTEMSCKCTFSSIPTLACTLKGDTSGVSNINITVSRTCKLWAMGLFCFITWHQESLLKCTFRCLSNIRFSSGNVRKLATF